MKPLFWLSILVGSLVAFGVGVLFWAAVSQIRFLSFFRTQAERPPDLGVQGWTAFYFRTLFGAYCILWWAIRAPFQTGLRIPGQVTGRPVLCVHGLFMNSTAVWGIRRRLERLGRPTRAVYMGVPFPTPMRYRKPLARAVETMGQQFPDEGFDVVAHSIGGVMLREVLRQRPELAHPIRGIVTLGSPHHGTSALRIIRFGPIYRMLSRNSEYLEGLPSFVELAPRAEAVTIASLHDLVVYPAATAHLEGAREITLEAVSHLGLLTDGATLERLGALLEQEKPQTRATLSS